MINELSQVPVKDDKKVTDEAILRQAIMAEYDAINLYEQIAASAKNSKVKKLLLDIAKEEKVHVGEFEGMLETLDKEHKPNVANGKREFKSFQEFISSF
jgi:rubrerythrin